MSVRIAEREEEVGIRWNLRVSFEDSQHGASLKFFFESESSLVGWVSRLVPGSNLLPLCV